MPFNFFANFFRQRAVVQQIFVQSELDSSLSGCAVGEPIRRARQQFFHYFAAGSRRVANVVSEFVKRIENPRCGRRSVQPDAVRDPAVLVGIIRQQHGNSALRRRRSCQTQPARCQIGYEITPAGLNGVPGNWTLRKFISIRLRLECQRSGQKSAINLRQCNIHRDVASRQSFAS